MIKELLAYIKREYELIDPIDYVLYPSRAGTLMTVGIYSNGNLSLVAKFGGTEEHNHLALALQKKLSLVDNALRGTELEGTTPTPLGIVKIDDRCCSIEKALSGEPGNKYAGVLLHKRRIKTVLKRTVDWMIGFQQNFTSIPTLDGDMIGLIGQSDRTKGIHDHLGVGPMHRDLVISNVLITKKGDYTNIIDWEDFALGGFPIVDLISLSVSIAALVFGENPFERVFYERNWLSISVYQELSRYARTLNYDVMTIKRNIPIYLNHSIMMTKRWYNMKWYNELKELSNSYDPSYVIW